MQTVRFFLSPWERELILRHGYPWDDFEAALKAAQRDPDAVAFELSAFHFEFLVSEIARSANHTKSGKREDELSELFEYLVGEGRDHGLRL